MARVMARVDSTIYNTKVLPFDMLWAPRRDQIGYLDPVLHGSDPDMGSFLENFSIQQTPHDCDCR